MNLKEVHRVLNDMFQKELTNGRKRHIVFWYDKEGEFVNDIDDIQLDNVHIWKLTDHNLFATKYELEKNAPDAHFLIYANKKKPIPREDWLYDLYMVGQEFATDKITVMMRELGINDDGLRDTFKAYKVFFNNKTRFQAFQKYHVDHYTEEVIDLTVLAALCKSATNEMDDIVRTLLRSYQAKDDTIWENIQKFGSEEKFWSLVEKYYGYTLKQQSIQSLVIFFMLTYLAQQNPNLTWPQNWEKYISARPTNAIVFMNQWMNHQAERPVYNALAKDIAEVIQAKHYMDQLDMNEIIDLDSFSVFDESIIQYLVGQLSGGLKQFDHYHDIISKRRKLHWYPEFQHQYEAVYQAAQLLEEMMKLGDFIPEQTADRMFHDYREKYYVIDTAYRKFYVAYDQIEDKESLHPLREKVENVYVNQFVAELAVKWTGSLEREDRHAWTLAGIHQQKDFYRDWVRPYRDNDERVFVIISDALRFDVAKELTDDLNNQLKASTKIAAMQSVLPSYTALGMAALLPHKQLQYTQDAKVLVDGLDSAGTINRNTILQAAIPDSMAIRYSEVVRVNRDVLRENFQGKKVIYIYHNAIDARGDNAATEMEVFQAAEEAIADIRGLVNLLVNNISASNILITADHGFIYQRDTIHMSQKISQKPADVIWMNRRAAISTQHESLEGTFTYDMGDLLDQSEERFVTVPKGINRFAVQGAGANYVHGGAMLQEVVVPVITFKNDRSKSSRNEVKKVDVKLTTPTRKITNTITYLAFFQTSKLEAKKLPRQLKLYFADEEGNRVSNENIIIADSVATQASERTFREKFVFKALNYDKRKTYYLVLQEEEAKTAEIYETYPFTIDIAYTDEYRL